MFFVLRFYREGDNPNLRKVHRVAFLVPWHMVYVVIGDFARRHVGKVIVDACVDFVLEIDAVGFQIVFPLEISNSGELHIHRLDGMFVHVHVVSLQPLEHLQLDGHSVPVTFDDHDGGMGQRVFLVARFFYIEFVDGVLFSFGKVTPVEFCLALGRAKDYLPARNVVHLMDDLADGMVDRIGNIDFLSCHARFFRIFGFEADSDLVDAAFRVLIDVHGGIVVVPVIGARLCGLFLVWCCFRLVGGGFFSGFVRLVGGGGCGVVHGVVV